MLDSEVILYVRSVASHSLGEQELNKWCKVYGQYTLKLINTKLLLSVYLHHTMWQNSGQAIWMLLIKKVLMGDWIVNEWP